MKIKDVLLLKMANYTQNTERRYLALLKTFEVFIGKPAEEATARDALEYVAFRRKSGRSDATIHQDFYLLRNLYTLAADLEVVPKNPFNAVKTAISWRQSRQVRPTKYVKSETVKRALETTDDLDGALLSVFFGCGLRISEVQKLLLGDIRVSPSGVIYLFIRSPKGGTDRSHPIPKWAWPRICKYVTKRKSEGAQSEDYIFISSRADNKDRPIDIRTIARRYKARVGTAPHSARASYATQLIIQGYHYEDVAQALGHRDTRAVKIYNKRTLDVESCCGRHIDYDFFVDGKDGEE